MSDDERAELEALKDDQNYEDWINRITDPDLPPVQSRKVRCRMCGKWCPESYVRGHICIDCDVQAGELLNPILK